MHALMHVNINIRFNIYIINIKNKYVMHMFCHIKELLVL